MNDRYLDRCLWSIMKNSVSIELHARSHWLLLEGFVQNVFETYLNSRYHRVKKSEKKIRHFSYVNFKGKITIVHLFFTRWYLKLRFVSNIFWTKIPKSSHSGSGATMWKKNTHFLASYCCYHLHTIPVLEWPHLNSWA